MSENFRFKFYLTLEGHNKPETDQTLSNVLRQVKEFYICSVMDNTVHVLKDLVSNCHGIRLPPLVEFHEANLLLRTLA